MQSDIDFIGFGKKKKKGGAWKVKSMMIDVEVRRWLLRFFRPAFQGSDGGQKRKIPLLRLNFRGI